MAEEDLHVVVVTRADGTTLAVLTALHVARSKAMGRTAEVARDAATIAPVMVRVDTALHDAARIMLDRGINHVLVADADGRPAGIASAECRVALRRRSSRGRGRCAWRRTGRRRRA